MKKSLQTLIVTTMFAVIFTSSTAMAQQINATTAPTKANPEAFALLKSAHDARQTWPATFAGFTAEVMFNDNGKVSAGTLAYANTTGAEIKIKGLSEEAGEWLNNQLNSLLSHRRGGDFAKGDGRHPITFGVDDKSPLGRLLQLNDSLHSSYRVRDGQTVEVTRIMNGERFTITVLDTKSVEGGKYLPHNFTVTYFDAKTGQIKRSDMFTDAYEKKWGLWYPTSRRIVRAENGKLTTRIVEIRNPKSKSASEQAAKK